MRLLALYTLFGFSGFFVTMSALPAWIVQRPGVTEAMAGLVTTVLLVATVSTQSLVPRMLAVLGTPAVLALGLILLGGPSLLFLIDGGYLWVLAISAVRGIGFGILTVIGSMLTARIVAPQRRGEAVGIYGLSIAVPNLLAVAGGVALVTAGRFDVVAVIGAAPLLGLFTVGALARAAGDDPEAPTSSRPDPTERLRLRRARRTARTAAMGPAFVLMVVTLTSGGFMTYLPIVRPDGAVATVALLIWGATGAAARWRVGTIADRSGLRRLLPGSSVLSIAGILIVVAGLQVDGTWATATILVGSAILGTGYGATQNLSLVAAFMRARQQQTATVSAVWNIGFDAGTAAGSGLVGLLTVVMTIPPALALTSLLVLVSMPVAIRSARPPVRAPGPG